MEPKLKHPEKHQPHKLPVEPEMDKGLDEDTSSRTPDTEPPKEKRVDDL